MIQAVPPPPGGTGQLCGTDPTPLQLKRASPSSSVSHVNLCRLCHGHAYGFQISKQLAVRTHLCARCADVPEHAVQWQVPAATVSNARTGPCVRQVTRRPSHVRKLSDAETSKTIARAPHTETSQGPWMVFGYAVCSMYPGRVTVLSLSAVRTAGHEECKLVPGLAWPACALEGNRRVRRRRLKHRLTSGPVTGVMTGSGACCCWV